MKKLLEFALAALLIASLTPKAHSAPRRHAHCRVASSSDVIQPVLLANRQINPLDRGDASVSRDGLFYGRYDGLEKDEFGTATVSGIVVNYTGHRLRYIEIDFRLLDRKGMQIGTAMANTQFLADKAAWQFEAIGLGHNQNVVKVECVAMFGIR